MHSARTQWDSEDSMSFRGIPQNSDGFPRGMPAECLCCLPLVCIQLRAQHALSAHAQALASEDPHRIMGGTCARIVTACMLAFCIPTTKA